MTPIELHENYILCLIQLRLSKWQAIWNKSFELSSIKQIENPAIEKAELAGALDENQLTIVKNKLSQDTQTKLFEINKLDMEIQMLDQMIEAGQLSGVITVIAFPDDVVDDEEKRQVFISNVQEKLGVVTEINKQSLQYNRYEKPRE